MKQVIKGFSGNTEDWYSNADFDIFTLTIEEEAGTRDKKTEQTLGSTKVVCTASARYGFRVAQPKP